MELKICVWNWVDYNEGNDNWKWFDLPNQVNDLEEYMDDLIEKGREEFFICDTDGNSFIEENTPIDSVVALSEIDEDDLLAEYLDNNPDETVISMDEIDDILCGMNFTEIANMVHFGDYNPNDDYFKFDGYGNIKTFNEQEKTEYYYKYITQQATEFLHNY